MENTDKALEMGKTSATGSFQLLMGVATSTIVMAVGSIILGNLLTQDEYGLYTIALAPSALISLFRDWGVNSAMTKYIASLKVSNSDEEIHDFIVAGLVFEVASGIALSLLSLFLASFIASFYHKPESASYIAIISVSIICGSLLTASQAGFIGYERMELNSFTLVCQAIAKTVVGLALVFLGYSVLGAVIGYTMGFLAAGIIGLATFYLMLLRPLRKKRTRKFNVTKTLKIMLSYGLPLSIGSIMAGILGQIYAFVVIPLTSTSMYGNYAVAVNFSVLLTFFTVPIATVLFPAFAKLDPHNERELVKNVFASSVKYTSILVIPATMVLMVLSGPIVRTLYGEKYVFGPFFLTISVVGTLFAVLGSLSTGSFLSGMGETGTLLKQNVLTITVGIPLGLILIPALGALSPSLGITGFIVAGVLSGVPSMLWVLYWIWKHYGARADFQSSAKIMATSALAAVAAYLLISPYLPVSRYLPSRYLPLSVHWSVRLFEMAEWIKLIVGLVVFLTVYVLAAPTVGAVSLTDLSTLRTMFSGMGIVSSMLDIPLKAAETVAAMKTSNTNGESSISKG